MDGISDSSTGILRKVGTPYSARNRNHTRAVFETSRHVEANVRLAKRLRSNRYDVLNAQERLWVDAAINDTEEALRSDCQQSCIGKEDKTRGHGLIMARKAVWRLKGKHELQDRHLRLVACHQSLTAAISLLFSKIVASPPPVKTNEAKEKALTYDPEIEQLYMWHNRHRRGRSSLSSEEDAVPEAKCIQTDGRSDKSNYAARNCDPAFRPSFVGTNVQGEDSTSAGAHVRGTAASFSEGQISEGANTNSQSLTGLPPHAISSCNTEELWKLEEIGKHFRPPFASRIRASSLPGNRVHEEVQRLSSTYPMSPSDYLIGGLQTPKTQLHASNPRIVQIDSCDNLIHPYAPNNQRQVKMPIINKISDRIRPITLRDLRNDLLEGNTNAVYESRSPSRSFEEADGLEVADGAQPVCLPYQLPYLSVSKVSLCPSLASSTEFSQVAGQTSRGNSSETYFDTENVQFRSSVDVGTSSSSVKSLQAGAVPTSISLPVTDAEHLPGSPPTSNQSRNGAKKGARSWLAFHADRSNADPASG